jgi:hypothetical protein
LYLYLTKNGDDGAVLAGETFLQMRNKLGAKILSKEANHVAAILGLPIATPWIVRAVRVCRYPKPLGLLVALIVLAFATTTLQAQIPTPTQQQELNKAVRPASNLETYRQPVIMCTVGRTGFLGNAGRQAATIERTVALLAYVVLGGILFGSEGDMFRKMQIAAAGFGADAIIVRGSGTTVHSRDGITVDQTQTVSNYWDHPKTNAIAI